MFDPKGRNLIESGEVRDRGTRRPRDARVEVAASLRCRAFRLSIL